MYQNYVKLRDERGLSDYRVSIDTNIPKSTFSEWKSGRSKPKVEKLKILANYFGTTVDFLINDNEKGYDNN